MQTGQMKRAGDENSFLSDSYLSIRALELHDLPLLAEWMKWETIESLQVYFGALATVQPNHKLIVLLERKPVALIELLSSNLSSLHVPYKSVVGQLCCSVSIHPDYHTRIETCKGIIRLFIHYTKDHISTPPVLWEIHLAETFYHALALESGFKCLKTTGLNTLYRYVN